MAVRPQLLGHSASITLPCGVTGTKPSLTSSVRPFGLNSSTIRPSVLSQILQQVFGPSASIPLPFGLYSSVIRRHRYLAKSGIKCSALRPQFLGHSALGTYPNLATGIRPFGLNFLAIQHQLLGPSASQVLTQIWDQVFGRLA